MDDLFVIGIFGLGAIVLIFGLPIWALIRTREIGRLRARVEGLEAAVMRLMREGASSATPVVPPASAQPEMEQSPLRPELEPAPEPQPAFVQVEQEPGPSLEKTIGERWLVWAGVGVLLFAAAFFLKYTFDNRWIGELGRIFIGLAFGVGLVWMGRQRHQAGWKWFAQGLTAGGAAVLYLSTYAASAFYDLVSPTGAFVALAVLIALTHALAVAYGAPLIALMGQIGGFLTPILLSTGRDRYAVLFTYIALLTAGAVFVSLLRNWKWVASVSFLFAQALFWAWYADNYHPEKLWACIAFQSALFLLFLAAEFWPLRREAAWSAENWGRLFLNPLAYFGALYVLLEADHPEWMGLLALTLATLYAATGRAVLRWSASVRRSALGAVAVSLAFITLAIPIQLEAHWITLAWGLQGAILAWIGLKTGSARLRWSSLAAMVLALAHLLFFDLPWTVIPRFTPALNAEFLSAIGLAAIIGWTAMRVRPEDRRMAIVYGAAALALGWIAMTWEIWRYTEMLVREAAMEDYSAVRALEWRGNMAVSILWSLYAAGLIAGGLRLGAGWLRWAGLGLFGLTALKAFFFDIAALDGFYRVLAFFALGLLLLGVAWGYQRIARRERPEGGSV